MAEEGESRAKHSTYTAFWFHPLPTIPWGNPILYARQGSLSHHRRCFILAVSHYPARLCRVMHMRWYMLTLDCSSLGWVRSHACLAGASLHGGGLGKVEVEVEVEVVEEDGPRWLGRYGVRGEPLLVLVQRVN